MKAFSAVSFMLVVILADRGLAAPTSTKADPEIGRALAERVCVACHVVSRRPSTTVTDVPSFPAIANIPGQSMETIAGRIVVPHPPMIAIPLTRAEIADLAAYIMTLKEPGGNNP
jgi:cytochrome c